VTLEREEVDALALGVLRSLDDVDVASLYVLAEGLRFTWSAWYLPVFYAASDREAGRDYTWLTLDVTGMALEALARDEDRIEQLRDSGQGFWLAAATAAQEIADANAAVPS
jgi:hypothetical protein